MENKVTLGALPKGARFIWSKEEPDLVCTVVSHDEKQPFVWYRYDGNQSLVCNKVTAEVLRVADVVVPIGRKDDQQKPRPDLFSADFQLEIAKVLAHGAAKYGADNWKLVERWRYVAATGRHWLAVLRGEKLDPETGFSHLAHLACNLSFIFEKDKNAASTKPVSP